MCSGRVVLAFYVLWVLEALFAPFVVMYNTIWIGTHHYSDAARRLCSYYRSRPPKELGSIPPPPRAGWFTIVHAK